jgi:GT2 family glycosyltransferase/glycosyltransferase involved in cell wall biosynthesis
MAAARPELPLYVVSEFQPAAGEWIPYHVFRTLRENLSACRAALRGKRIAQSAMVLSAGAPLGRMRAMALWLAYGKVRIEGAGAFAGEYARPFLRWAKRLRSPAEARVPMLARLAQISGRLASSIRTVRARNSLRSIQTASGVSVVIPSRSGKELLQAMLPALVREQPDEIVVVDNGPDDGTEAWLAVAYPDIRVDRNAAPLSFADAVNRGIVLARFSHTLLLNNDMIVEPEFLPPLRRAFASTPDLFCSTAQIFFPPGVRRQETGKAVMRQMDVRDFPIRCEEPIPGEDQTWVLYGSGGCSLYDTAKLRALGGVSAIYRPAYVEDLDLGYRAWLRGWPSVFVAEARVEHRHRSTTARYFTPEQIDAMVQTNYLRFVASAVVSPALFRRLWSQAVRRLHLAGMEEPLRAAALIPWRHRPGEAPAMDEEQLLALTNGDVAVFPGRARASGGSVLVATPYLPFPLSHGGAVRMFNLMRQASVDRPQVLVSFCDRLATPPDELLELCAEIVLVRRRGTHYRKSTDRPDTVEEFDSPAFHAALRQTVRKWRPEIVQLEFTQMAQYAGDCAPARTILVEHDITFDLQEQLLRRSPADWELEQQLQRWRAFETAAWGAVDRVVTMSRKDRAAVGPKAVCLPNGVDTARFQATGESAVPNRLLFIGSFAHLPNVLAIEYFLAEIWPLLENVTLHIVAGARHEEFKKIDGPRIEVQGFVADVRPAYARAAVVIAPLTASAGTNIKILEAMAMGKAIVSTTAGINGLDLTSGRELLVADGAQAFASAIRQLLQDRASIESAAREAALRFDWTAIAREQERVYQSLFTDDLVERHGDGAQSA